MGWGGAGKVEGRGEKRETDCKAVVTRLQWEPRAGKAQSYKSSLLKEYSGDRRRKLT